MSQTQNWQHVWRIVLITKFIARLINNGMSADNGLGQVLQTLSSRVSRKSAD